MIIGIGKMVNVSEILLYITIVAILGILSVYCEEAPSINNIAKVTLDNDEFGADISENSKIVIFSINETNGAEGSEGIIHAIPSYPGTGNLTPTNLLLLVTVDNPLALKEGVSTYNAESAKQWLYQGNDNYNNSSYEKALNCYEKAIALVDNSPVLWYYKGDALYQLQKYADAVLSYKKATNLAPNFLEAWNNLALSYAKLGLNDEANAALAEMQKLKSNNVLML
jgi:hypothetical protein